MELLNSILESEEVRSAGAAVVSAGLLFVVAYLRELAARMAAQAGAMHAEEVGRQTGAKGADKMDLAATHAKAALGVFAPRRKRLERIVEGRIPEARKSLMPPTNGVN